MRLFDDVEPVMDRLQLEPHIIQRPNRILERELACTKFTDRVQLLISGSDSGIGFAGDLLRGSIPIERS
jgi:hypothetical protein